MQLKVKRLTPDAVLPIKAHPTDSGFDLFSNEDVYIKPGRTVVVKTGIALELPTRHEAQIRPRSGVTSKTKLRVQLGTIDEGYRGEIGIIVDNIKSSTTTLHATAFTIAGELITTDELHEEGTYLLRKGDKLAQLVVAPVAHPEVVVVDEIGTGDRGENGFGSTGI